MEVLIVESKVEFLRGLFERKLSAAAAERGDSGVFETLASTYPATLLQPAIKWYLSGELALDDEEAQLAAADLEELSKKKLVRGFDANRASLAEMKAVVAEARPRTSKRAQEQQAKVEGATLLTTGPVRVYELETMEASKILGRGTKLCTSSSIAGNSFPMWHQRFRLFLCVLPDGSKVQLSAMRGVDESWFVRMIADAQRKAAGASTTSGLEFGGGASPGDWLFSQVDKAFPAKDARNVDLPPESWPDAPELYALVPELARARKIMADALEADASTSGISRMRAVKRYGSLYLATLPFVAAQAPEAVASLKSPGMPLAATAPARGPQGIDVVDTVNGLVTMPPASLVSHVRGMAQGSGMGASAVFAQQLTGLLGMVRSSLDEESKALAAYAESVGEGAKGKIIMKAAKDVADAVYEELLKVKRRMEPLLES